MQWSSDLRAYLAEICDFMGIIHRKPTNRAEHQWLSCYNAVLVDEPRLLL